MKKYFLTAFNKESLIKKRIFNKNVILKKYWEIFSNKFLKKLLKRELYYLKHSIDYR